MNYLDKLNNATLLQNLKAR